MFRKSLKRSVYILLLAGLTHLSAEEISIGVPSARTSALGGVHAAYTGDLSSLFNNPAGFSSAPAQLSIAEITIGASGPIFDISNIVIQAFGDTDITELLGTETVQELVQSIYAAADVAGPIYFGYIGRGLGFGFFNTTDVSFSSSGPLTITAVIGEQIMLSGGYALRLPFGGEDHLFDAGILLKGALRGEVELERSLLELAALFENIGVETITGEPFLFVAGIGLDLGFRYSFRDVFAFGLVARDLFTPTLTQNFTSLDAFLENTETPTQIDGLLPIDLSAGFMFSPNLGRLERYVNDVLVLLDYRDIIDFVTHPATSVNPILHLGFGLQTSLLQILDIRMGFNQGLFSAGLGIDLSIFRLHISMFGSELSAEPGGRSVYNAMIGLEFRL